MKLLFQLHCFFHSCLSRSKQPPPLLILQSHQGLDKHPCMHIDCKCWFFFFFLEMHPCQTAFESKPVKCIDSNKGLTKFDSPLKNCKIVIKIPLELSRLGFPRWDSQISTSLLELEMSQQVTDKYPCTKEPMQWFLWAVAQFLVTKYSIYCVSSRVQILLLLWTREWENATKRIIQQLEPNLSKSSYQVLQGCGEQGILLLCWWECKWVQLLWEKSKKVPQKVKNRTTIWSAGLSWWLSSKELQSQTRLGTHT